MPGLALLSDRYLCPEMELVRDRLPEPSALAYVIRRARKTRNTALDNLIAEITAEVSRNGALSLAA